VSSVRDRITMTDAERARFLAEELTVTCATLGPGGRPHLMPLWFVVEGPDLVAWTYAKSQKVRNLERRPQATLQVEAGTRYGELRGVVLECDVEIVRDPARVAAAGEAMARRYYAPGPELSAEVRAGVAKQAAKRVALRFSPTRVISWDHRKLGGA